MGVLSSLFVFRKALRVAAVCPTAAGEAGKEQLMEYKNVYEKVSRRWAAAACGCQAHHTRSVRGETDQNGRFPGTAPSADHTDAKACPLPGALHLPQGTPHPRSAVPASKGWTAVTGRLCRTLPAGEAVGLQRSARPCQPPAFEPLYRGLL